MNCNKISFYLLCFSAILICTNFSFYNLNASQFLQASQSEKEREIARLFYTQILRDDLDGFVKALNNYPQYINLVIYHSGYKDFLTPLQLAVIFGKDRFIDELLKRQADSSLSTLIKKNTILHLSNIPHITKRFIDLGLNLEALNYQHMTPLLSQVFKVELNREVILTLLQAGANVRAETDITGLTALHILFRPHHIRNNQKDLLMILKDILDYNGKLVARDKRGATALHFAAARNNVQAIQILVDKAKQLRIEDFVNIRSLNGNTPLFTAYTYQSKEAISELLKLGANPLLLNKAIVSVNGSAHRGSQSSRFDKFVLDEIDRFFRLPGSCLQSLVRERIALLHESR